MSLPDSSRETRLRYAAPVVYGRGSEKISCTLELSFLSMKVYCGIFIVA